MCALKPQSCQVSLKHIWLMGGQGFASGCNQTQLAWSRWWHTGGSGKITAQMTLHSNCAVKIKIHMKSIFNLHFKHIFMQQLWAILFASPGLNPAQVAITLTAIHHQNCLGCSWRSSAWLQHFPAGLQIWSGDFSVILQTPCSDEEIEAHLAKRLWSGFISPEYSNCLCHLCTKLIYCYCVGAVYRHAMWTYFIGLQILRK